MTNPQLVTQLLNQFGAGNQEAQNQLAGLVYDSLKRLASRHMKGERAGHTLQTTALVHEAYERLVVADVSWQDRAHFYAVAARAMRRILVDHAKSRRRDKRGAGLAPVGLDDVLLVAPERPADLVDLDEALSRLASFDERKSRLIELHFFGGLTYEETAKALGVSPATVDRELRFAKAWLQRELQERE